MITYWVSVHISHPVPSLECILKVLLWPDHAWQLGSPAAPAQMMQRSHYSFCRNHPTVLTDQQLPYPSLQFPIRNQSVKSKHVPPNQTHKMPCLWPSSSSPGPATLKKGSLKGFSLFHSWSGWGQIVFFRYTRDRSRIETGIHPDLAPAVLPSWPSHLVLLSQEESVSLLRHFCLSPSWEGWLTNLVFSALTPARHTADAPHRSGAARRNCFWTTSARHAAEKHLEREHKIHFMFCFGERLGFLIFLLGCGVSWGHCPGKMWNKSDMCVHHGVPQESGKPGIKKKQEAWHLGTILKWSKAPNSPSQTLKILQ